MYAVQVKIGKIALDFDFLRCSVSHSSELCKIEFIFRMFGKGISELLSFSKGVAAMLTRLCGSIKL